MANNTIKNTKKQGFISKCNEWLNKGTTQVDEKNFRQPESMWAPVQQLATIVNGLEWNSLR